MLLIIASLLAGLGLFFMGMYFLTEHLKMLSGRRLRERISRLTRHPLQGVLWGGVFFAITQSTSATTFILIGMLRSGMMKVRQTLPIIAGTNMLAGLTVLVLAFDIKAFILLLIGVTGFLYTNNKQKTLRALAGALFGIGLLFYGLNTMQSGVAPLAETEWFKSALHWTQGSYIFGFIIGAALAFVVQASLAVVVLAIAFQTAGLFTLSESIMIVYGANVGSSILTIALSSNLHGESKQVAMFQAAYNITGAFILLPLFYLEIYGGIPVIKAATEAMSGDIATQVAIVYFAFNFFPGIILLLLLSSVVVLLKKFWPESLEERASKPKYLHDHATEDASGAIHLIELEQIRLLKLLSTTFNAMREGEDRSQLPAFKEAFDTLSSIIRGAIDDLSDRSKLSPESYNRLNQLMNIQHSLETADAELNILGEVLDTLRRVDVGSRFSRTAVEGLDAILLTLMDVANERSKEDADFLNMMTSEDGNGIAKVRSAYLSEESRLDSAHRLQMLSASNHCERLIWLFGEMGRNYIEMNTA